MSEHVETPKEKILRTAQELFGEYGYSGTTFKKIAERAGITLGLISHHFGSKENLYILSSLNVLEQVEVRIVEAVSQAENGYEAVENFLRAYFDCSVDPTFNFKILVSCSPYNDIKDEINKDEVTNKFEQLIHMLAKYIILGMQDGSIRECESMRTADIIFATIVGSVRTRLLSPFSWDGFYRDVILFICDRLKKE
ncbi:TetR/AcrR family transcriptional regulator [Desulfovibrio inopinatus]|uniref:TetR/AcrR family transcriptional regulator n=1 Tax=Desulfovibrio inopinatus TaxID=102109 RepID=UPI00041BE4FD|nr:TetR/AcrR family transcriptional regulator [Desulfovibrio inopinatus]